MKYVVVVVDDSKFVHKLIEKLFDPTLFDAHFFTSAEETKKALETFAAQGRNVDLVLLDILMHDIDGWTHAEIAVELEISAVNSRQHLFQGRRLLREFLEREDNTEVTND